MSSTNLYSLVEVVDTTYKPLGSGLVIDYSNITFIVTANHVVPRNGAVYYRIPKKGGGKPFHRPHKAIAKLSGLGWIRSDKDDLAVTAIALDAATDSVTAIPIQPATAAYREVSIGDEVFVIGYPTSVVYVFASDPAIHFVRNGVVASKIGNGRILIDAFLFPGNSGGPVFWKPARGLAFGSGLSGRDIPSRPAKLVGIVLGTLPYREKAISTQTGKTRVIFEDNSGLAVIISASKILDLLDHKDITAAIKRLRTETKLKAR